MSYRLPQSLDLPAPRAPLPRGEAVDFDRLDNSLQRAAATVAAVDRARDEADGAEAERIVANDILPAYAPGSVARRADYDGRAPGLTEAEVQGLEEAIAPVLAREDLADGVRLQLTRRLDRLRAETRLQAVEAEAVARAERTRLDRAAAVQVAAVAREQTFLSGWAETYEARVREEGGQPGFADRLGAAYGEALNAYLATLPPEEADAVRPRLLNFGLGQFNRALAAEEDALQAATARDATTAINALVNRAGRDPTLLANLDVEAGPLLAALPAALRAETLAELRRDVTVATLDGRISRGEGAAVRDELAAGRYDDLDPRQLAALQNRIASADTMAEAARAARGVEIEARQEVSLDAFIRTGVLPETAPTVDEVLASRGPEAATAWAVELQAAEIVRPVLQALPAMDDTARARLLEAAPLPDSVNQAVQQAALRQIRDAVTADGRLRGADGAVWAMTSRVEGDGPATVAGLWQRLTGAEAGFDPAAAQAYARATLEVQARGEVPAAARRLLPRDWLEDRVRGLDGLEPAQRGQALAELAELARAFGPYGPRIYGEMDAAGLSAPMVGGLIAYGDRPSRLQAFARLAAADVSAIPRAERGRVESEVNEALAGLTDSYVGLEGGSNQANWLRRAALTYALGLIAGGAERDEAVQAATRTLTEPYVFRGTLRLPRAEARDHSRIIVGLARTVGGLMLDDGAGLYAAPGRDPDEARRLYRDRVRSTARWTTNPDNSGATLVYRDAAGTWRPVRRADGGRVSLTWAEALAVER